MAEAPLCAWSRLVADVHGGNSVDVAFVVYAETGRAFVLLSQVGASGLGTPLVHLSGCAAFSHSCAAF